jgi:hypothetical protein
MPVDTKFVLAEAERYKKAMQGFDRRIAALSDAYKEAIKNYGGAEARSSYC